MPEQQKQQTQKQATTSRDQEIKQLIKVGRTKRTPQQAAQLSQLKSEVNRERFLSLASKRVNHALKALSNVGRLGNKALYTYTAEEADKIGVALRDAAIDAGESFSGVVVKKLAFTL